MSLVDMVLLGLVLPAAVAAIALAVARLVGRRAGRPSVEWGVALALGGAYLAGHAGIVWLASDVTDRVPYLALAATALGILEGAWPGPFWTRWENRLLFSALVVGVMVGPADLEVLEVRNPNLWLAGLGLGVLASWANLEALAGRIRGIAIALPMIVLAGGAGAILLLSGSMLLGRLAGALTAAVAAGWLVSSRGEPLSFARGGVPVIVVVLSALLLEGHVYSQLTTTPLVLVAAAPLALWITRVGPLRRLGPWPSAIVGAVAVLIPIGVAAGMALMATPASEY